MLGSGGAVLVRVACTFLVAQLLTMQYVKLIGGAVIIWIAVKLLTDTADEECHGKEAQDIWQALWIIIVADMSMGIDNMLAVGAASHGNLFLLLFGLIPDPIPVLGYLDDLILLPLGILLLVKLLPEEVMADCRATAAASAGGKKPTNWFAGAIIGAIWLGAIYLTVRLLWGFFQPTEP